MEDTKQEKWERGKTLMLESLHKPDDRLRGCAHNQECFHELLEIREQVIEIVREMPNPHTPPLPFDKKNDFKTPVNEHGISETVVSGALKDYYGSLGDGNE